MRAGSGLKTDCCGARCKRLQSLTTAEKAVLRGYISERTRTQYLSIMDGVVTGLAAEDILYRASNASYSATEWAYNIQPWAWEYLSKHPEYVLHPSDPTREQ